MIIVLGVATLVMLTQRSVGAWIPLSTEADGRCVEGDLILHLPVLDRL